VSTLAASDPKDKLIRPIYVSFLFAAFFIFGILFYGTENLTIIFSVFVFAANMVCSFEKRKSPILSLLLLTIAFILMAATNNTNGSNGDYRAYNELYTHFLNGGSISNIYGYKTDYGYMTLMLWVSKLGVSYSFFAVIVTSAAIALIYPVISKISNHYNLILSCYALSPFFYDAFQLRYFFAYAIVIFSFRYVLFERSHNLFKYALFVLVASLFHSTVLFFLLYLLLKFSVKYIVRILVFLSISVTAYSFITHTNVVDLASKFVNFSKFDYYSSGSITYKLNVFTPFMVILVMAYFMFIIHKIYKESPTFINRRVFYMNMLNIIIFPFLLISLDFERFMRPILLINYAIIASSLYSFKIKRPIILLLSLFIVLGLRQYFMFNVTSTIFENNFIFERLNILFN
jgi:hypothetical protein